MARSSRYRQIPVKLEDFEKLLIIKGIYEENAKEKITWSQFFMSLGTGYCVGMAIIYPNAFQFNLREAKQ